MGRWFKGMDAWFVGSALGYLGSSLVASILFRVQIGTPLTILLMLIAVSLIAVAVWGLPTDYADGGRWHFATCFWAMVIVVVPFSKIGIRLAEGVAYRAYFSADLMTHLSVIAELQKGTFPLQNPFFGGGNLGYYWLFFSFPAMFGQWTSNEIALLVTYLGSGLLFSGLLYVTFRSFSLVPARAFLASFVLLGAVGFDGLVALLRNEPWRNVNVDAISRWVFELISIDGLHRSLLYTPQHLFSYSLLLVLILVLIRGGPRDLQEAILAGVLLGGMAGTSIVTAMIVGPWFVVVSWRRRRGVSSFPSVLVATVTSLGLLFWYFHLGFFGGASEALTFRVPMVLEFLSVILLDVGALFLILLTRRMSQIEFDWDLLLLATLSISTVLFVDVRGYEGVWMAWRAGSILLISLGLYALRNLRWIHAFFVVPALFTLLLDTYNAADVTNRTQSPGGFPWTTIVSPDEFETLAWIRREIDPEAVVQWDVKARQPGEWALIPALGERRMAVGFPIFLLELKKYRVRERRSLRPIFVSGDPVQAHLLARQLGIDYIIIGPQELHVRGERVRPLFEAKDRFRRVFERGEVTVLEVLAP